MSWKDGLEGPSYRIAATNESPLRVLAGPGTGKTFTLIRRVARLLEENMPPKSILVTTFTRTAAGDLKRELESMNVPGASSVHSTTLHALCFRILSRQHVLEITGRVPRPLLEFEKRFLLEDLKHMTSRNIRDLKKRLLAFAAAWARDQRDKPGWPNKPFDKLFEYHLQAWLKFHKAMLIEELVPEALRFLRSNPESSERIAYSHVLVDEYQDLNVSEQEFIRYISENAKLTIIGDEDQSIYSFRHAHPEGIAKFHDRYPETKDETLDVCRRCPENIVELANQLISHNRRRTKRVLVAHPDNESARVHVVQWSSMEQEAQGIAEYTKKLIRDNRVEAGRVLILAPRKQFGYEVRDALRSVDVQAHSFFKEQELDGDSTDLESCRAQEAFTLLTLAANPEDHVALRCWCGFGSLNLRAVAWSRIRDLCEGDGLSLPDGIAGIRSGKLKLKYGAQIIKRLDELEVRLQELSSLQGQKLFDSLFPENDPDFEQIRGVLAEGIDPDVDAPHLLDYLRTSIIQPELPTEVEYVRVMSLHKSKGLTADLVIVMGCVEGLIPAYSGSSSQEECDLFFEEQRRLFYVAITRARKYLVLSSVTSLPVAVAHKMRSKVYRSSAGYSRTITSSLINELGPTCPRPVSGAKFLANSNSVEGLVDSPSLPQKIITHS